jgi:hypothetical protein
MGGMGMAETEVALAAVRCAYCGMPLPAQAGGRRAKYCDTKCRVAGHRERREAEERAARIPELESALTDAYQQLTTAAGSAVDAARLGQDPESGTLMLDLVHARKALADLGTAARELHDSRLLAARYGIAPGGPG